MKIDKKYLRNILLIFILGFGSIYLSLGNDFEEITQIFKSTNIFWLSIIFIVMLLYYILDGFILYVFGKIYKKAYKYKQAFSNAISGTFFNGITPFASGGQFAQVYIFNKQGIAPANAASILLMCFIVYQSVLVLFTGVIMIFRFQTYAAMYDKFISLALLGFIINFTVIVSLFIGAKSKRFQDFVCNKIIALLGKLRILKDPEGTQLRFTDHLANFRKELGVLQKNIKVLLIAFLCNLGKLLCVYSVPYFCAKALGLYSPIDMLPDFIGICSFVYMITAFVPIPGASGGSEGIYFILFSQILGPLGTPSTLILWRFATYYLGLILGGIIFSTDKEINR